MKYVEKVTKSGKLYITRPSIKHSSLSTLNNISTCMQAHNTQVSRPISLYPLKMSIVIKKGGMITFH